MLFMFKRRHPYLFFILVFTAIISTFSIAINIVTGVMLRKDVEAVEGVGIIEVRGMIVDATGITDQLKAFRENDNIKAIVLRIESPGGGVGPSQEIYREIRRTVGVKPVVASMGAMAASGGYYVAAGTDGIMANPGTITGSIGVLMQFTNFREMFEKIGIQSDIIKSAEYKDIGSPFRDLSEDEESTLQQFVDSVHRQFIVDVASGRNMSEEEISDVADGMIFSGEYAKEKGLVDRLGNFNDAVEWAGEKAGLEDDIARIYPPKEKFSFIRKILEMAAGEMEATLNRVHMGTVKGGYLYSP